MSDSPPSWVLNLMYRVLLLGYWFKRVSFWDMSSQEELVKSGLFDMAIWVMVDGRLAREKVLLDEVMLMLVMGGLAGEMKDEEGTDTWKDGVWLQYPSVAVIVSDLDRVMSVEAMPSVKWTVP